jgi:hypothetical protein
MGQHDGPFAFGWGEILGNPCIKSAARSMEESVSLHAFAFGWGEILGRVSLIGPERCCLDILVRWSRP